MFCIYIYIYIIWWAVFGLNVTSGYVYGEWNLSVLISGCFHRASLLWFISKNCYDSMYYVIILKVCIKSNYIPTCFVGSHYHHQISSLCKLKHQIIKKKKLPHYTHTFWVYQNFSNLYKTHTAGKIFRYITDLYFMIYTWGHILGVLIR